MGPPFRVGLYTHVSTHDQHTLFLQLDVLRTYAAQLSWSAVTKVQMAGSSPPEAPSP
jgi:hypothetical protein